MSYYIDVMAGDLKATWESCHFSPDSIGKDSPTLRKLVIISLVFSLYSPACVFEHKINRIRPFVLPQTDN